MSLPLEPWSLSQSSTDSRDRLIQFWLSAPSDDLERLWLHQYGSLTKHLIQELTPNFNFTPSQVSLRSEIGQRFDSHGLNHPGSVQLMIVNFLLSPPGLLTINNVDNFFPSWLSSTYKEIYTSSTHSVDSSPSSVFTPPSFSPPKEPIHEPDFGEFPSSLSDLISNRVHLNRLLGLSNLYYIDPEDIEIRDELISVRNSLAVLIDQSPESSLEQLWSTDLGDRYWSLVRSGIQKESLSESDSAIKASSVKMLNPDSNGGFGKPGAINAFLIAMMYFLPGTMQVPDPESKIPSWLLSKYLQIFSSPIES